MLNFLLSILAHNLRFLKEYEGAAERFRKAQDRLRDEPFDIEAWGIFIREYQVSSC